MWTSCELSPFIIPLLLLRKKGNEYGRLRTFAPGGHPRGRGRTNWGGRCDTGLGAVWIRGCRNTGCEEIIVLTNLRKTMKTVFLASFFLLVCTRSCVGQTSTPPFQVQVVSELSSSDRRLECRTLVGFEVQEAIFFRNGIQEGTTDVCVPASNNGALAFNNTPACDGHYFCGTFESENDVFILSGPETVLGKFCLKFFVRLL